MKIAKITILSVLSLLLVSLVQAEFYVSAGLGSLHNTGSSIKNGFESDYDQSLMYSLAVGYDLPFLDIARVEAEYLHNRAKIESGTGKVTYDGLMVNGYLDIPFPVPLLTPYVGVGVGPGRFEGENLMSYQGIIGIDAEVFVVPVIGSLEYRYMKTNQDSKRANESYKFYAHAVMLKLRYEF